MKNIAEAILKVTEGIKGLEKDITVGSGNYGYAGISEKMVKTTVKSLMIENGLSILQTGVESNSRVDRWEENNRSKQSIFTEVTTKYLLLHTSGESIELGGYGQGVDTQDKGAGKATTYALKNTLMNTFMMITGEDTDSTHSQDIEVPQKKKQQKPKFGHENYKGFITEKDGQAPKDRYETFDEAMEVIKTAYDVDSHYEEQIKLLYNN